MIAILISQGITNQKDIGDKLGRDQSVISRELKRNSTKVDWFSSPRGNVEVYFPEKAEKKYRDRINKSNITYPFKSPDLMRYVLPRLKLGMSPQTISGRLLVDYPDNKYMRISPEKIYQDCFSKYGINHDWNSLLLRGKNKRRKRVYKRAGVGLIPNRVDIDERSNEANERLEFGHWEADTIWSKQNCSGLLVIVERMTRKTMVSYIPRRTMKDVSEATSRLLGGIKRHVRSITYDNGSEFSNHIKVAKELNCNTYFCKPYHSWERGTCENTNGRLRRKYPKGTDFSKICITELQDNLKILVNNHPRKCLNYLTPNEVFQREVEKYAFTR
jgi:IS30 family transposase